MESLRLLKLKKIIKPIKFKHCSSQRLISRNISPYKTNSKTQNEIPNTSWDFTPFPDLYFPAEKKQIIRKINRLNFDQILTTPITPININYKNNLNNILNINSNRHKNRRTKINFNVDLTPKLIKSGSFVFLQQEKKGDITKNSPPSYSFGLSREDCKFPILKFNEKISPSPCSYNLRPLEGLGGSSLKYSINKDGLLKKFRKQVDPGPGYYNLDKNDIKNNGKIILSNLENSKISNFSKYEERRDNIGVNNEYKIKPDPSSYDITNSITMFSGTGRFPNSRFRSNIGKSINKFSGLSRGNLKFIYPGPGNYNHYSIFKSNN